MSTLSYKFKSVVIPALVAISIVAGALFLIGVFVKQSTVVYTICNKETGECVDGTTPSVSNGCVEFYNIENRNVTFIGKGIMCGKYITYQEKK